MSDKSYHWYSVKQRVCIDEGRRNNQGKTHSCFCRLKDGSIHEYTEATQKNEPFGNWDDYIEVGYGVFDHLEDR